MAVVGSRYAEAFFGSVPSGAASAAAGRALSGLSDLWRASEEFRFFMQNPVVPDAVKKETVRMAVSDDCVEETGAVFLNFIHLLIDKDRFSLLPEISAEYESIRVRNGNGLIISVYSPEALDGDQLERIREKFRAEHGAAFAVANNHIDPSLIGGLRIKIGDKLIDDSLSGRLSRLLSAIERQP